jgi:hypothetical protein
MIGQEISHCHILEKLACGMGMIYKAQEAKPGSPLTAES